MTRSGIGAAVVVLALLFAAAPARAELVFFGTGRSISVKSHVLDGDMLILELRGGGQVTCDRAAVSRIEPDEVPDAESAPAVSGPPVPPKSVAQIVDDVALEQGLTPKMVKLVKAVIQVESGFRERARSPKGAMGPMQLMPETARRYSVADPYEARSNIEAGIRHLTDLLGRFELPLALAAYNAGEGAIRRFGGQPPYRETREYVAEVLRLLER